MTDDTSQISKPTILPKWLYVLITLIGFVATIVLIFCLFLNNHRLEQDTFFFLLLFFGLAVALLFFGLTEVYADVEGKVLGFAVKAGGPFGAMLIIMIFGFYMHGTSMQISSLNVQLHGPAGLNDIPIKGVANKLVMVPTNGSQAIVQHIDPNGIAKFSPPDDFYSDSVYFQLLDDHFQLSQPNLKYKLKKNEQLQLQVSSIKVLFVFTFVDKADHNHHIPNVHIVSHELQLNAISDDLGVVEHAADIHGKEVYNFSLSCPGYSYDGPVQLYTNQTTPVISLEKMQ